MRLIKKSFLLVMVLLMLSLVGCSEENKFYKQIKQTYESNNWEETISLVNEFKEYYPEDKHVEELNQLAEDSIYQLNLIKGQELLNQMKEHNNKEEWNDLISLSKQVLSLIPNTDIANEAKKLAEDAQSKLDAIELASLYSDLQSSYTKEDWSSVINVAMKITTKFSSTDEAKTAKEYSDTASAKLLEIKNKRLKSLLGKFSKDVDEVEGNTFYMPNSIPKYVNDRCSFAVYLGTSKNNTWLRWRLSYTGDNWVFFEKIIINVDGEKWTRKFDYYNDISRDNKYGDVWEVADINPTNLDIQWIDKIASSTKTIVRFEGDNRSYDYTVTSKDKQGLKDILEAYELMK